MPILKSLAINATVKQMEMIKYQDNKPNNLGEYYQEWLDKMNLQKLDESFSTSSEDEEDEMSHTLGVCASLTSPQE